MNDILFELEELISNAEIEDSHDYFSKLSLLIQRRYDVINPSLTTDFLFSRENDPKCQRFIAYCFIRIIGSPNENHFSNFKHQILKLIVEALPDLCSQLDINDKTETYKKEIILRDYINTKDVELLDTLQFKGNIEELNNFQQVFRRTIAAKKNGIFEVFCPELVNRRQLDTIFNKVNEFVDEPEETKHTRYKEAKEALEQYLVEINSNKSKYSEKILLPTFTHIYHLIDKQIESSPYSLKPTLELNSTEKKYPFSLGSINKLDISIANLGMGFAKNVKIVIADYDRNSIKIDEKEQYIGTLKISSSIVEFNYESLKNKTRIIVKVRVSFEHSFDKKASFLKNISFWAQASDRDWQNIGLIEPYNLEPVETGNELVGRESILQRLQSMLNKPLGSAYIYGQRRVGKTSIVKTLQSSIHDPSIQVQYIEAGDWNDANSAFSSMENIGRKICRKISRFDPRFAHVKIPDFNGSFNKVAEYLDDINEIDPNFRLLLILDEFDRISSDLYERGDIGRSFVLTLRAISNRSQIGIILVGGEKLEHILSQWQEFNKFSPIRVDYFSRERDWEDFRKLIRKPVENILEISDSAIALIFDETSGNPYFTKKICIELYSTMVQNRDIHVTKKEAMAAVDKARSSSNIGATDFSHFWEDGIKGKVEKEEETSLKRRKVLILITQIYINGSDPTKQNIIDYGVTIGIRYQDVEKYLVEFEQRKIIFFENDRISFVVNFFKEWLITGGKEKIIATFEEEERVSINQQIEEKLKVKPDEILTVIKNFGAYKGKDLTLENVRTWLDQFEDIPDQRVAFKLLSNFKLYDEVEIRRKLVSIFDHARKTLASSGNVRVIEGKNQKRNEFLISYLDKSPAKGSTYFTKIFSDENNIYYDNVCSPEQLEKKIIEKPAIKSLILIDDFIGSGKTIGDNFEAYFIESLRDLVKTRNINIVIGTITVYLSSKQKILDRLAPLGLDISIQVADMLSEEDKCFNTGSVIFDTPAETKKAKEMCYQIGERLEPKAPLGYSDCQSLIAFPMNCPNNTLPIFWKKTTNWRPLFERN